MFRFIRWVSEALFWVAAFLSPALGAVIIAAAINISNPDLISLPIFIMVVGVITGVIFAERVRRKYGCSTYFGRLLYTPELDRENDSTSKKEEK